MNLRRAAALLATVGLAVGLIGAGVSASYSDNATAAENIAVGQFGCNLTTTTPNAVVTDNGHTVTFADPEIQVSNPPQGGNDNGGLSVDLHNTGSMAVRAHWTIVGPSYNPSDYPYNVAPWNTYHSGTPGPGQTGTFGTSAGSPSMLTDAAVLVGATKHYDSLGFMWLTPLTNSDLGATITATYHVDCSEVPATSGIQFIAGASASSYTVAIPAACHAGDLILATAWNASSAYKALDSGLTTYTHYYYSSAGIGEQTGWKIMGSTDTSISAATGTGQPSAIEIACYRHAAVGVNQPGSYFISPGGNGASSATIACTQPGVIFGFGSLPIDGSAAAVCMEGTTSTTTNIKSMFSPPVTIVTPPGSLANRSAGFASAQTGLADTADSLVTAWPAGGAVLASWTQSPASNHGIVTYGLVYAP